MTKILFWGFDEFMHGNLVICVKDGGSGKKTPGKTRY